MLILSEADVKKCCSISTAISANRKALSSLRKNGCGGAIVPTRIGLPYPGSSNNTNNTSSTSSPADWSLFKPAAYYPIESQNQTNETDEEEEISMGVKVVSPRANNPIKFNKPTVPATTMLLNAETGEVSAIIAATYLTALRTAAGSALATELVFNNDHRKMSKGLSLCVFGAGLQAELHIKCIQHVVDIKKLVIINRSYKRAENLKKMILALCLTDITVVLLSDEEKVKNAVNDADIMCTTTNTGTPLFKGEWIRPGCHINGVGSYTPQMAEIDENTVKRCEVLIDTKEALHVGDLSCLTEESHNFCGLIGDALEKNIVFGKQRDDTDCTFFKSVGTSIQDVISANVVVEYAIKNNIGTRVQM